VVLLKTLILGEVTPCLSVGTRRYLHSERPCCPHRQGQFVYMDDTSRYCVTEDFCMFDVSELTSGLYV
jgi:hypothetical protein